MQSFKEWDNRNACIYLSFFVLRRVQVYVGVHMNHCPFDAKNSKFILLTWSIRANYFWLFDQMSMSTWQEQKLGYQFL